MKRILVSFIQDRSGSMATVWNETLNGFRTYIEQLQADQQKDGEVEYLFSLTTFDTRIDTPHIGTAIGQVKADALAEFGPRGSTALYDAVGKTLQAIDDRKSLTFDKAIVVVVTDGQENSSREWSKTALHAAIDERIKRGNWTFTYLGTQPETWDEAQSLGVGVGASANYDATNAQAVYATVASATANMSRCAAPQSVSFLHDNTTPMMRSAARMSTRTDAAGSSPFKPAPKPAARPHLPPKKPSVSTTSRWR